MKRTDKVIVSLFLLLFFVVSVGVISYKSITNDELAHIPAGYSYWKTFSFRMNTEHPPLMKLIAGFPLLFLNPRLPVESEYWKQSSEWNFGHIFMFQTGNNADLIVLMARIPMIFVAMLLGFYIFKWASELYNTKAGYVALTLYIFNPLVLGHAGLVTTDVGVAAFIFISLYYFWRFCKEPSGTNLILTGVFSGLAFAAKFTGIYIVPMFGLLAAVNYWRSSKSIKELFSAGFLKVLLNLALILIIGIAILILSYGVFEFPKYFVGLGHVLIHSGIGHKAYLLGVHSDKGFWYYFFLAFLFKEPIPLLILLAGSIILYRWLKKGNNQELFLLIPIAFYLFAFMVNKVNIGLRHILPVYPFLFVFIGKLSTWRFRYRSLFIIPLICWYVLIAAMLFPHYLSYFNEFAGGSENGWTVLIDSNVDWGQDLKGLKVWMNENNVSKVKMAYFGHDDRDYRKIGYEVLKCGPTEGILAVSVNRLVGFDREEHKCLAWLRDSGLRPMANIGYSIYIYNVTKEQANEIVNNICIDECNIFCSEKGLKFENARFTENRCVCECSSV